MTHHGHLGVARPVIGDCASSGQRHAHRMQTPDKLGALGELVEDAGAHARHYPHRTYNVGRVGEFDAYFGDGTTDGSHAVGYYVHGATAHTARKAAIYFALKVGGREPVAQLTAFYVGQVGVGIGGLCSGAFVYWDGLDFFGRAYESA